MSNEFEGNERDVATFEELQQQLEADRSRSDTPEMVAFRAFFEELGARNFTADEFMVMGASHNGGGTCSGKNSLAPRNLWDNVKPLVAAMDAVRDRLGHSVMLTNVYRNPEYNECVGGVAGSQHKEFKAADFVCHSGSSADWAEAAKAVRSDGGFSGGVGIYNGFVHVDVRGSNADWDNRT